MQRFDNLVSLAEEKNVKVEQPAVKRGFVLGTEGCHFSDTKKKKKKKKEREPSSPCPRFRTSALRFFCNSSSSSFFNCLKLPTVVDNLKRAISQIRKFHYRLGHSENSKEDYLKKNSLPEIILETSIFVSSGFSRKVFEVCSK